MVQIGILVQYRVLSHLYIREVSDAFVEVSLKTRAQDKEPLSFKGSSLENFPETPILYKTAL